MSTTNRQLKTLKETLHGLSLSDREVQVFLSLTKLGLSTPGELSKHLKSIPRTSIYDLLRSLQEAGLVSTFEENDKIYFQTNNIEYIVDTLEQQKKEIENKQDALRSVADIFKQMKSGSLYKPNIRFFEGKKGIIAIQRELQNARKETRTIVDIASVAKVFPRMLVEDNLKDFQTHNILKKDLMIKTSEAERYLKVAFVNDLHQVRWLPKNMQFQTDTLIWEGHVAILDYSDQLSGIIIDNPTISQTFVAWFEMMWGISEG